MSTGAILREPAQPSPESVNAIFDPIDGLAGGDFLPEGLPDRPPTPPNDDVSLDR